jgi:5'-3' exonuclease
VCFDGKNSFRKEISKDYKASRRKTKGTNITLFDGTKLNVPETPGGFIKSCKQALDFLGIQHAHVDGLEADDLMAGCAKHLSTCVIVTRDKDLASCVTRTVNLYWPVEKLIVDKDKVLQHFEVHPHQIRDYLCLLGDKVDDIKGIDRWGPKTCSKFLAKYGSIKKALDTKDGKAILKPHLKTLVLARSLVSLNYDFKPKSTAIKFNESTLAKIPDSLWKVPDAYRHLSIKKSSPKINKLYYS